MRALRVFLYVRRRKGEWEVATYEDLENLVQAWKLHEALGGDSGVIHIGFTGLDSIEFEAMADRFPHQMLCTATARFALGALAGDAILPIGEVSGLPIYVAANGSAFRSAATYKEGESRASAPLGAGVTSGHCVVTSGVFAERTTQDWHAQEAKEVPAIAWRRARWVQSIGENDVDLARQTEAAEIRDEFSYLQREQSLSPLQRTRLAQYRAVFLLDASERDDPRFVARCAPPWLLEQPITLLDLSTRASNTLNIAGVDTVSALCCFTYESLMRLPNLGRKSYRNVADALWKALEQGAPGYVPAARADSTDWKNATIAPHIVGDERHNENEKPHALPCEQEEQAGTFVAALDKAIGSLGEARASVLRRRMGFGDRRETLQEIADTLKVTRERVRQIERKATRILGKLPIWSTVLIPKLHAVIKDRETAMPMLGLDVLDPWFQGIDDLRSPFDYCLKNFIGHTFSLLEIDGQCYVSRLSAERWRGTVDSGELLMKCGVEEKWQEAQAHQIIDSLLVGDGQELRAELWRRVSKKAKFSSADNGPPTLVSVGNSREDLIETVMVDSDRPLHFVEVARRVRERFGRDLSDRNAQSVCGSVGLLFGRGTYGLAKHFPLSGSETALVVDAAEDIIEQGVQRRQWHCGELCDELTKRDFDFEERLDPYVLCIALHHSKVLAYLGRFIWARARGKHLKSAHRIDVGQAVISLVREAGHPMSTKEIISRLKEERGVSNVFQIHPSGDLLPLGDGMWGLSDRDMGIDEVAQKAIINEIAVILSERQAGLHATEIIAALRARADVAPVIADPRTLMALAQQDRRMRVSYGQYLYLADWGQPRRLQAVDGIRIALQEAPNGLAIDEIVKRATEVVGRPITREATAGALRNVGAQWNEETGRWLLSASQEDEDEHVEYNEVAA